MTDLTGWTFRRFQSARSGKWRLCLSGQVDGRTVDTSAVASIDTASGVVTTCSGSRYRLVGPWAYAWTAGAPQALPDIVAWFGEWEAKEVSDAPA